MRLTLLTAAAILGGIITAAAQTATLGTLRPSSTVVTQEVDAVALAALSASNTAARAAITNESLYRAQADAAALSEMLASNAVATAAITTEALARYVADTNEAALRASAILLEAADRTTAINVATNALASASEASIVAATSGIPAQTAAAITAATNPIPAQTAAAITAATNPIPAQTAAAITAATNAIPRVPTNAVTGWLLYDSGSNKWLRVTVSNYFYYISEVL